VVCFVGFQFVSGLHSSGFKRRVRPMKKIGVLFGMENSFPGALVERINARNIDGIEAEFVETGAVHLNKMPRYSVIVDRISHDIPFYRAFVKHAALNGTVIINNPFWWSADDKFFNYTLAARLGVAVPPTVILPHKQLPEGTTDRSMRNLEYPLNWDGVFAYVGEHGFLKPVNGGGWRDVYHVHNREEFFRAYDESRDLCMMYQKAVDFTEYFRCYVVNQKQVHIMPYDPRRPHADRYGQDTAQGVAGKRLLRRVERDALKLCRALGYDLNTVEFAVEKGIPYAIDFMNPAPDADLHSVGPANFEWIVEQVADMAIGKAKTAPRVLELRWSAFLGAIPARAAERKPASKRAEKAVGAVTKKDSKLVEDEEAAAAADEPMGSVAAAVARNEGSAQTPADKAETPKPAAEATPTPPSK
jgi:glutathione synthase/RimK-type ligase-like ATP-grasp enzyme